MPIDHIGLNVPDVPAALAYYDELFAMVGYVRGWETGYRPHDWYSLVRQSSSSTWSRDTPRTARSIAASV